MRDETLLSGWRVLVLEDQFLIAGEVCRLVASLGGATIGPCRSMAQARTLISGDDPDFAILDINLNGDTVFPFAAELDDRRVPFVFASGYQDFILPDRHKGIRRLNKPLSRLELVEVVRRLRTRV